MTAIKPAFTIYGRLPGLNDIVSTNRTHWSKGAEIKREADELVRYSIKRDKVAHYTGRVQVRFSWHEPDRRRDPDNIESAKKFILDAMVAEHVINDDSPRYLVEGEPFRNWHGVDADNPHIDVYVVPEEVVLRNL